MDRMLFLIMASAIFPATLSAEPLERCSYKTKNYDGKIITQVEEPSPADGSNKRRFDEIAANEASGKKEWEGYHTFDVSCTPLATDRKEWHLFVQTWNGTVSLIADLTELSCWQALYAADEHRNSRETSWQIEGSDFKRGQCFK